MYSIPWYPPNSIPPREAMTESICALDFVAQMYLSNGFPQLGRRYVMKCLCPSKTKPYKECLHLCKIP